MRHRFISILLLQINVYNIITQFIECYHTYLTLQLEGNEHEVIGTMYIIALT